MVQSSNRGVFVQLGALVNTDVTPEDMEKGMEAMAAGMKHPRDDDSAVDGEPAKATKVD